MPAGARIENRPNKGEIETKLGGVNWRCVDSGEDRVLDSLFSHDLGRASGALGSEEVN